MQHSKKSRTKPRHKYEFSALGTNWVIETPKILSLTTRHNIDERLELFDRTYSRFRDDSLVSQMKIPGKYVFPDDFKKVFEIYKKCFDLTNGLMTPMIGSVLEEAGYDKNYSLVPRDLHQPLSLDDIEYNGKNTITTKQPTTLDIGAAGKGYAVDIVCELLEASGCLEYVVDASGDIRHLGMPPEIIGLEDPMNPDRVIGTIELANASLCASASNRRAWREMHHIINPKTLKPVEDVVATWVVADEAIIADAMATALFFVESPNTLQHEFKFSYARLYKNRTIDYSPNFEGQLFT